MANLLSAKKRIKQNETRRARNRARKSVVKSSIRKFEDALKGHDTFFSGFTTSQLMQIKEQSYNTSQLMQIKKQSDRMEPIYYKTFKLDYVSGKAPKRGFRRPRI